MIQHREEVFGILFYKAASAIDTANENYTRIIYLWANANELHLTYAFQ